MKHIFIIGLLLSGSCSASAKVSERTVVADSSRKNTGEVMPSCPYDLVEYFQKNLHYPDKARRKKIDGRVLVGFVVSVDGSICDVKVVNSVNKILDKEAKRIVSAMPPWSPGTKNGVPVKVFYKLPVQFKLK